VTPSPRRIQRVVRPGGVPELNLRIFTIYRSPDPAQPYRVRQWKVSGSYVAPGWLRKAGDLEHARTLIPKWADTVMPRSQYDEAAIVESWL
jgi:hypothetical protein